ncbi:LysM domain-containing protein [Solirubrobacter taibaiensis]|nr:LysM domain-containing protein [Solirubrobacter taibaiensis]
MVGRNPARFLAPIALIAFAFALYSVVKDDEAPTGSTPASQTATATPSATATKKKKSSKPKTYTVKAGDTASGIAEEAGVDLETLMALNPELDPASLSPGQKIRLEE